MKLLSAMNSRLLATLLVTTFSWSAANADGSCLPRVAESPTKFPLKSQLRGQRGVVLVDVTVDASGRAASVELDRSSGHRLLDRAAASSITNEWRFDISACERKDLPVKHLVAVEYRNDEY